MRKLVEAALENRSARNVFLFRVTCASCGADYGNRPMLFSKADTSPTTENEKTIYSVLYEQEINIARQAAIRSAAEQMNYCPICKQLVCNQCFVICYELDMCARCAAELDQKGHPVLAAVIDEAI